jgi:hypothetical protein
VLIIFLSSSLFCLSPLEILNEFSSTIQRGNEKQREFARKIIKANKLGPIVFICPELGKWSTVGGLGVMVDELTQVTTRTLLTRSHFLQKKKPYILSCFRTWLLLAARFMLSLLITTRTVKVSLVTWQQTELGGFKTFISGLARNVVRLEFTKGG